MISKTLRIPEALMPWLELSLRCRAADEATLENALEDLGALSVTLLDATPTPTTNSAILEPGVGETPLWPELTLIALFDADTNPTGCCTRWNRSTAASTCRQRGFRTVDDPDWERAWMDQYVPLPFGARTWIVPWNQALPRSGRRRARAVVRLDPGLAFGSGTHPTTALCLRWLDGLRCCEARSCSTSAAAPASSRWPRSSSAPRAPSASTTTRRRCIASLDNAERNGVGDQLDVYAPEDEPCGDAIRSWSPISSPSALDALAETLATRVAPGGVIALSGILHGQEDELLLLYSHWFDELAVARQEDWMRITGRRMATP